MKQFILQLLTEEDQETQLYIHTYRTMAMNTQL